MATDTLWRTGKPITEVARALVGKTIADVSLEYVPTADGGSALGVECLAFTDGTRLFVAVNRRGHVCVDFVYPMPDAKIPRPPPGSGPQ